MIQRINSIEELTRIADSHIDCYVSTDEREIQEVLARIGFNSLPSGGVTYSNTGSKIECTDISFEEALGKKKDIDFLPMSRLRIYTNGSSNVAKMIIPIIKALDSERQNMAFIDHTGSKAYVKLSELYQFPPRIN